MTHSNTPQHPTLTAERKDQIRSSLCIRRSVGIRLGVLQPRVKATPSKREAAAHPTESFCSGFGSFHAFYPSWVLTAPCNCVMATGTTGRRRPAPSCFNDFPQKRGCRLLLIQKTHNPSIQQNERSIRRDENFRIGRSAGTRALIQAGPDQYDRTVRKAFKRTPRLPRTRTRTPFSILG